MVARTQGASGGSVGANVSSRRFRLLAVLYLVGMVVVMVRLWQLQVGNHERYSALASDQQEGHRQLAPTRGQIFAAERDGRGSTRLIPLAVNRDAFLVYADTRDIRDPQKTADALAQWLKMKPEDLLPVLSKENDPYEPLKHRVSSEAAEAIRALKLDGIGLIRENERFYPNNNIASHIAGFVRYHDGEMRGQYGLEGYYNDALAGMPGELKAERDASGVWIALSDREYTPSKNGDDLVLTIDWTIQFKVCQALDDWVKRHGASGGSVTILDPKTGAIIAMCGNPDFNPNVYNEVESIETFNNPAIFQQYEPGSVFKPLTMAMALEEQKVTPDSTYVDTGEEKIGPYTIRNSDNKAHGVQTMTQVLEESLNTGAIYAMRQVGASTFKKYIEAFGFGKPTGIELSGEAAGNIGRLNEKNDIYPATASFGQGISVTPLQMVSAFATIANGGRLMRPYIVQKVIHADGSEESHGPKEIRRIMSEKTAALLSGMLVNVVEYGHGKKAGVPGYYIAGKTGTAQIPRRDGKGYEEGVTIGSFVGFAPVRDPKFVMLVRVDRPRDVQFAESSAAPLFGELARFILQYNEVPPERK